jgi:hypothetical protein
LTIAKSERTPLCSPQLGCGERSIPIASAKPLILIAKIALTMSPDAAAGADQA